MGEDKSGNRAAQDASSRAFSLDEAQRWALAALVVLVVASAALTYLAFGLVVDGPRAPTEPRVNLFLASFLLLAPPALLVWVEIALISVLGAMVEVAWGVAYHGFWAKDYDPESALFSVTKILQAPFITLVAFGAAVFLLPFAITLSATLNAATGALAFLSGYYSADLLDAVHAGFTKLLGKTPLPLAARPLSKLGAHPLDLLARLPAVASLVEGDLPAAVAALRTAGVATTADLVAMKAEDLTRLAAERQVRPETLLALRGLAESLVTKPSLEEGLAHHARSAGKPATDVPLAERDRAAASEAVSAVIRP